MLRGETFLLVGGWRFISECEECWEGLATSVAGVTARQPRFARALPPHYHVTAAILFCGRRGNSTVLWTCAAAQNDGRSSDDMGMREGGPQMAASLIQHRRFPPFRLSFWSVCSCLFVSSFLWSPPFFPSSFLAPIFFLSLISMVSPTPFRTFLRSTRIHCHVF